MSKKLLAFFLAALMLFLLTACGKDGGANQGAGSISDGYVLKNEDSIDLGEPGTKLEPQAVYSKLTYTPEMFYGDYRLRGGDEAEEKFGAESQYFTWTRSGKETEFTKLPFRIQAGKDTMAHSIH